jgi:signal transduction histidine kinase
MKIFILDDDLSFRKILHLRLKSKFNTAEFIEASSIEEAKSIILNNYNQINLALIDQHLPDGIGAEILEMKELEDIPTIAMSSDDSPELPASTVKGGARFFVSKAQISYSFFLPLVSAIIERAQLEADLRKKQDTETKLETIKTLIRTLQHEINNPLGATFGATYLLKNLNSSEEDREKAIELINGSSKRIQQVLKQLVDTSELESVTKGGEELYQIPGDKKWN